MKKCKFCKSKSVVEIKRPAVHGPCGYRIGFNGIERCIKCNNESCLYVECDVSMNCFCNHRPDKHEEEVGQTNLDIQSLVNSNYGLSQGEQKKYNIDFSKLNADELKELQGLLHDVQSATLRRILDKEKIADFISKYDTFTSKELAETGVGLGVMWLVLNFLSTNGMLETKRIDGGVHYTKKMKYGKKMILTMINEWL
jgi:hypothetical protein